MGRAVSLFSLSLLNEAILPKLGKHGLDNFGVLWGWGSAEDVEFDIEPCVYFSMNGIVFCA